MLKLRFKNRKGVLYFGLGGKFKSSKMKDTKINRNIITGMFKRGDLDSDLNVIEDESIMLVELLRSVLMDKAKYLKHKTMIAYNSAFNVHLEPYFKNVRVKEVKPIHIKNFQDILADKGLKKPTINFCRVLLKEAFNLAVLSESITANPIMMVGVPRVKHIKEKKVPFTLDEIDAIIDKLSGSYRNFIGISFFTGMRSGEVLGLKWEDVDFSTNTISVNKTIADGVINSPKTPSSTRDIEMIDNAREFLIAQRLETGLQNDYLFLNTKGLHHSASYVFAKSFRKALKELGFDYRSLHTTRHTFASMMLNNGIEPLWVSRTLGHENLSITLNVYAHYMPKRDKIEIGFLKNRVKTGTVDK